MNAEEIVNSRRKSGPPTLTGSDVSTATVKLKILEARESPPEWNAPIVIRFSPTIKSKRGEIDSFGLNVTNAKAMIRRFGPNMESWKGKTIQLARTRGVNPTTGNDTWVLRVLE